ncbi:MAG: thioredoxin-disulfide reductase [Parcubacteria group bacterium]|nr:thioredoxin-disulfide reductase [Parcubacteria group bacterium]
MDIYDLIIIGGGPAGLTAGIYGGRAKLDPLIFTGSLGKGELATAIDIDDFPGFPQGISGLELLGLMEEQAKKYNCHLIPKEIIAVDFKQKPFKLVDDSNKEYFARAVIIASGGDIRWLGLDKEKEFIGHGISVCAVCDGAFFKNKKVAVVGGGDVALEDALYLTKYSEIIYLIHRRDQFRGSKFFQDEVQKNPKIKILFNSEVVKLEGDKQLERIVIKNNQTQEETKLDVNALFLAIGFQPVIGFLKNQLEIDEKGYIKVHDIVKTSVDGVFAAGDVCDSQYRQAITAAGAGAMAAIEADKWLRKEKMNK